ncbi:hypothetical protein RvY_08123-2 [Ramazzottius varieornatus]|uniref:Uncharacterized protein n=1 Tax=Ramazzottius varieornatus TaxID=947166 RepID=A0A1D1V4N0_RAMVA|nr:hypothetical protein RvY_08123-2 [Ramazzottius varieornatus]
MSTVSFLPSHGVCRRFAHGEMARRKITVNVSGENKLPDNDFVIPALKKSELCSVQDIGLLLKHVEQVDSDTSDRNQPTRSTPSFSLNDPDKFKGSSASLLLSIGTDLHREKCRNAMLSRKKNTEKRFRVGPPVPARKSLPVSIDITADSDRSPSLESAVKNHLFPNNEIGGSSLASSVAGWLSATSAESQGKSEQFFWFEPADNRAKQRTWLQETTDPRNIFSGSLYGSHQQETLRPSVHTRPEENGCRQSQCQAEITRFGQR